MKGLFNHAQPQSETNTQCRVWAMCESCGILFSSLTNFASLSVFLSVTMTIVTWLPMRSSVFPLDAELSESEKVHSVSWSINRIWFCLSLPGRPAVLIKLLNEAERGHLCSDPDDHACRWHGQTRWHLGANYTDFTPARV